MSDDARQSAFAPWHGPRRDQWVLFGLLAGVGSWGMWVVVDANMPWRMRMAVTGSAAMMFVLALRSYRRRRALDPIAAAWERRWMRFALACGMFMYCNDMITKLLPPAIARIPPMNALGALAITALTCWLLWLWQRRDGGFRIRAK